MLEYISLMAQTAQTHIMSILQCESKTGSSNTRQFMFSNLFIKLSNQPGFSTNASARPCAIARIVSACVSTSSLLGFGSFSFWEFLFDVWCIVFL